MRKKICVLGIDPQNDFCHEAGALCVPGAWEDGLRTKQLIQESIASIIDMLITLDGHRTLHVAHPIMWIDGAGNHPTPFITKITHKDVLDGTWTPFNPRWKKRALKYTKALEDNGRFDLTIWNPHCLLAMTKKVVRDPNNSDPDPNDPEQWMDFSGHAIMQPIAEALIEWEQKKFDSIKYVHKGENIWTEHYSAVEAEVRDPKDRNTWANNDIINFKAFKTADEIWCVGQALSHCYASTIRDLSKYLNDDIIRKMVLVLDTTSSVPTFEQDGLDFIEEMTTGRDNLGLVPMQTATVDDLLAVTA